MSTDDDRFRRIEDKLDTLVDVVVQLARIEEISSNQQMGINRINSRLDNYEERIEAIEIENSSANGGKKALQWLGTLIVGVLGAIFGFFSGGGQ